jgi:hypothetical protein
MFKFKKAENENKSSPKESIESLEKLQQLENELYADFSPNSRQVKAKIRLLKKLGERQIGLARKSKLW